MNTAWKSHLAAYRAAHTHYDLKTCMKEASKTYVRPTLGRSMHTILYSEALTMTKKRYRRQAPRAAWPWTNTSLDEMITNAKVIDDNIGRSGAGLYTAKVVEDVIVKVMKKGLESAKEVSFTKKMSRLRVGPRVYGAAESNDSFIIVLERLHGDLKFWLTTEPSESERSKAYEQIKGLFHRLHKNGVFHGDVHEHNIMFKRSLDNSMEWRLIDFGWSHDIDHPPSRKSPNHKWVDRNDHRVDEWLEKTILRVKQ